MIEGLANKLALRIKEADPEGETSVEVMEYALGVILNFIFTVLISCLIGWMTGKLLDTIIVVVGFGALRYFSGGVHMKSLTACTIVSVAIFSIVPHIVLSSTLVIIFTSIVIIIMILFSPNTYEETVNRVLTNFTLKAASALIVLPNLYFQSSSIALIFLIQAILILPRKGGGGHEHEENYCEKTV
ncbi:accessory gene regulator ArgB-like protein [Paenibacillus thiaminolyticus]|uniref:accessory gene regulator ArgB-like protein n=1 Tax=Paenibacillus thiaminolyticus TaxID=49283 RepID=UPI00254287BD|nr:accessory gene regulator B family protein [Paenibacillus thiaminolyticus]WII39220.1 accessory gene regulator B family protein [Paenibacillus thiaminolyticus]